MSAKHQPVGAFTAKKLTKAPDADTHPLAPRATTPDTSVTASSDAKLTPFSARIDPDLLRKVKIAAVTRGITVQSITAEAFKLWLDQHNDGL